MKKPKTKKLGVWLKEWGVDVKTYSIDCVPLTTSMFYGGERSLEMEYDEAVARAIWEGVVFRMGVRRAQQLMALRILDTYGLPKDLVKF
jgi:hypothetical protein